MAKATRETGHRHEEERYVAKMNFRGEVILQNQIDRLNKEKLMRVKSLTAQMRIYERKLQKINNRIGEVEQLSRNAVDPSQRLPTREFFDRLSSDVTNQRHLETGVGYSYINQLLGETRPLLNRNLRWGLNPSLPNLHQQISKPVTVATDTGSKTFLTEIKGHSIYLQPRKAVHTNRQKQTTLVLPPLAEAVDNEHDHGGPSPSSDRKENGIALLDADKKEKILTTDTKKINHETPGLSPIPEGEIELKQRSHGTGSKYANEATSKQGENKQAVVTQEKYPSCENELDIMTVDRKPVSDEKMLSINSSLRFPLYGRNDFTHNIEVLNIDTSVLEKGKLLNENKPNLFRYQLPTRRFSF